MKTEEVKKRGLGLMRSILANIAAFFDLRQTGGGAGVAMQAAERGMDNTASFDAGAMPAAGEVKTVEEVAVEEFVKLLAVDVQRAFETGTDPVTGTQWPERKRDYAHPILVKTGKLRNAAIAAAQLATGTGYGVEVNLIEPAYGFYHQLGAPRANLPVRRFFGASAETLEKTASTVLMTVQNMMMNWGRS